MIRNKIKLKLNWKIYFPAEIVTKISFKPEVHILVEDGISIAL